MNTFLQDPSARLDYTVDWSAWLGGDALASVAWDAPAGLTLTPSGSTDTAATAWLEGGQAGGEYEVSCSVTTAAGRRDRRALRLRVWAA